MSFLQPDTLDLQSSAQMMQPSVSGRHRHQGLARISTGDNRRILNEAIQHWAATSAQETLQVTNFSSGMDMKMEPGFASPLSGFSSGSDPLGHISNSFPDLMASPDSPLFCPGDALRAATLDDVYTSAFGIADAPLMELSASSGAATGYSNDFPGSDGSFSTGALSPHFRLDNCSEEDVPYLDMYSTGQAPWSPSIGSADLSVPSACSNGAMLPTHFLNSPTGYASPEEFHPQVPSDGSLISGLTSLDHPAMSGGACEFVDMGSPIQSDSFLTARHSPIIFSGPTFTIPTEGAHAKAFYSNRLSADGETIKARQHELYNVGPGPDGLYHCPFVNSNDGCTRKPDKLKCNYDKHMDSHLKPYRCQDPACADVPFSSTACLLRHEREAHGLHGHGDRPFSCHFESCERAAPGNGFPRRWNLQDHMRRVHNFVLPDNDSNGSPETGRQRKKRSSTVSSSSKRVNRVGTGRPRA